MMASAVQGFEVILENFHWKMKKKQKQKMLTNTKMVKLLGQLSYVFKSS